MLEWLRHKEREDVLIEVPSIMLVFNHRLKIAILYDSDAGMPGNRYQELEKHLKRRGYLLQVVVGSATGQERL